MELTDIFARTPEEEIAASQPAPVAEETPAVEAEAPAPVQAPAPQEDPRVPLAALLDERNKRQELEHQLRQLQESKPDVTEEDYFDNPQKVIGSVRSEMQQQLSALRMDISEATLRSVKPDFDEKMDAFSDAVKGNPALVAGLRSHPNPALFAYTEGEKHQLYKEIGSNPAAYKEKMKAEILASLQPSGTPAARVSVPDTLSGVTNQRPGSATQSFEPTPLNQILKRS